MPQLNLTSDELLATTRSVRKRLDFSRPVESELIRECLELAVQAPTGSNMQGWHFVVVTDAAKEKGHWRDVSSIVYVVSPTTRCWQCYYSQRCTYFSFNHEQSEGLIPISRG